MVVKNEQNRIVGSIADIIDLFSDVVIIDTGSTDETRGVLEKEFGIVPHLLPVDEKEGPYQVRNLGHELLKTPWILNLDGDETVERGDILALQGLSPPAHVAGYFCAWNTYKNGVTIRDYKLSLFQRGCKYTKGRHANIQYGLRQENKKALWLDGCTILHYPEAEKYAWKGELYKQCMIEGIQENADWFRHHWFLGYTFFCEDNFREAQHFLLRAARSHSMDFPVECLNSKMVLADIYAKQKMRGELEDILLGAERFYELVADDFEVKVNFRMKQWIDEALHYCRADLLDKITVYPFSY